MFLVSTVIQEALSVSGILRGNFETLTDPADKFHQTLIILNSLLQRLVKRNLVPISELIFIPLNDKKIILPKVDFNTDLETIFSSYYIQFIIIALADSLLRSFIGQGQEYPSTLQSTYLTFYKEVSMLAAPKIIYKRKKAYNRPI